VLYAIAEVENPYTTAVPLRIGSYVTARIKGRHYENIAQVPRAAVRPGNKLWMVNAKNQLEPRVVTPIRSDENYLYVTGEIESGEVISITPLENPLPGTEVKFTEIDNPLISASND